MQRKQPKMQAISLNSARFTDIFTKIQQNKAIRTETITNELNCSCFHCLPRITKKFYKILIFPIKLPRPHIRHLNIYSPEQTDVFDFS